jgi:pantoate--beta-alanine ligase
MRMVNSVDEMKHLTMDAHRQGRTVGLVPTMGALHEGHMSLVRLARKHADMVVTSVFVNPIQFGRGEDLAHYPRDLERDRELLETEGNDVLFAPDQEMMYPPGFVTRVCVADLSDRLCGAFRPGHFDGVTTVVAKLFHIVVPDVAVFGQKDAQQIIIIRRMLRDLNWDIELIVGPTIREPDGLAMSSRNSYLTPQEREDATVLYEALQHTRQIVERGEFQASVLIREMKRLIEAKKTARIDYIAVVDPETLDDLDEVRNRALVATAVHFGTARLIDNILIEVKNCGITRGIDQ